MELKINNVDLRYFYGEPLIDINRFAELFLMCLPYKDGVLDINENIAVGKLPIDYEDKISEYIDEIGGKEKTADLLDLDFYYYNTEAWFKELEHALNVYIFKCDFIKVNSKSDRNNNIISMPYTKILETLGKYDKDLIKKMLELTTSITTKKETDLERLGKMINTLGVSNKKEYR